MANIQIVLTVGNLPTSNELGDILEVLSPAHKLSSEEKTKFGVITVTGTSMNALQHLKREWNSKLTITETATDRYTIGATKEDSKGKGAVTTEQIAGFSTEMGATEVSDFVFDLTPADAGASPDYRSKTLLWADDFPGGVTFASVGDVVTMFHPGATQAYLNNLAVGLTQNGELIDQTKTETVYRVDKTKLKADLDRALEKYNTGSENPHQYHLSAAGVTALIAVSQKQTMDETAFLALVENKVDG